MTIEPGPLLPYRRLVRSIPTGHVRVSDGLAGAYDQGIVDELARGLILRSLGHKGLASGLAAMARISRVN